MIFFPSHSCVSYIQSSIDWKQKKQNEQEQTTNIDSITWLNPHSWVGAASSSIKNTSLYDLAILFIRRSTLKYDSYRKNQPAYERSNDWEIKVFIFYLSLFSIGLISIRRDIDLCLFCISDSGGKWSVVNHWTFNCPSSIFSNTYPRYEDWKQSVEQLEDENHRR